MKIVLLSTLIMISNLLFSQNRNIIIAEENNILIYELKRSDEVHFSFDLKFYKGDVQKVMLKLFPVNSASDVYVYKIATIDMPKSELLKLKPLIHQQNIVPDRPINVDLSHIEKGIYRVSYVSLGSSVTGTIYVE